MAWPLLADVSVLVCMQQPLHALPALDHIGKYNPHGPTQHEHVPVYQRSVRISGGHVARDEVSGRAIDLTDYIDLGKAEKLLGAVRE
jgi:hypothetical protein